ncbi:oxygen-dependent tRNA uridine(34) hydroxylase TrhO [Alkalitalea saponilacus]|uniref:tRNA uridine(34) hydroxylase n=1 Tax=Alkalitalea saponilacus TaxID=889453 RepID=A0A1T5DEE5_9BACT|nr:rhodanese-related sulfurtransferase [Alkalitalea saponilacus]ASB51198.1 hypothetical protein CDL62_16715 [Alkalitalea saponilacus]SKB69893.1 UPF0176 protein [Alkalitalea saponilacus]
MQLHNKLSKPELIARLNAETFKRKTVSFYRYVNIHNPEEFRDKLYLDWSSLNCLGRIYVAHEGINAQMSIPEQNVSAFCDLLDNSKELQNMPLKWAIEDDGHSFYKLVIRVRPKIVADGLSEDVFDTTNVGNHLTPIEFHELAQNPDVFVVDMRNSYESEVGHFKNAICPNVSTFREEVEAVVDMLADKKDEKILLYCTGGVRCEKASAWLKHHGFKDVNQLHGGIIAYFREIHQAGEKSAFIGKNFVFDNRLGERITPDVLANCHQCGKPCDNHTNCAYQPCHDLIIQCDECKAKYNGCCSDICHEHQQKGTSHHRFHELVGKVNKRKAVNR